MAKIFDVYKYVRARKTIKSDDFNGLQDSLTASFDSIGDALATSAPAGHLGVSTPLHVGEPLDNEHATTKTYVDGLVATSAANAVLTAADVVTTHADVVLTHADVVLTNADVVSTSNDVITTNADVVTAGNSVAVAASHANAAAAVYDQFDDRYLGDKATPPTLDNDGNTLLTGSLYWDTSSDAMLAYNGSAWLIAYTPATGLLSNLVEDTSPQLGGDLDLNGHVITDLVVSDTSPQLGGDLDLNGNKILGFSSIPTQAVIMAYINI